MHSNDIVLQNSEELLGMVRRRPMVELPRFLFGILWLFSPFFFFFPLISLGPIGWIFFLILFLSGIAYISRRYKMWQHSMLLITTERVIDIEQVGFRKRHVFELNYEEVDSVLVYAPGLIGRLLRTGRVHIQTSSIHNFDLEVMGVYKPDSVRQLILDVQCLYQATRLHGKEKRTK